MIDLPGMRNGRSTGDRSPDAASVPELETGPSAALDAIEGPSGAGHLPPSTGDQPRDVGDRGWAAGGDIHTNGSGNGSGNGAIAVVGNGAVIGDHPAVLEGPEPIRSAPTRRRSPRLTVSLVIPAKNEARNLPGVLERVPKCIDELILVDGRSTDVTQLMAKSCRPDIRIVSELGPGKGNALRAGFAAAAGEIIVAMDADGSMSPDEIPLMLYFLEHGFDYVKGSRFIGGGGSLDITLLRRLGNRGLLAIANLLYDTKLTDLCYGFFGFHRRYLEHLDPLASGFEIETELTLRAIIAGLRVAEIPSMEMPRRSGRSSLRSLPDGVRVLQTLLRERRPDEVHRRFLPPARPAAASVFFETPKAF